MGSPQSATYQLVFHKSYDEIEPHITRLKEECVSYLVGEHPADDDVATTHCHIAISGINTRALTTKAACETIRGWLPDSIKGRGQYVIMDKTQHTRLLYDWNMLCQYILKGKREYFKCKSDNITEEDIQRWIDAYNQVKQEKQKVKEEKQKKKEYTQWDVIMEVRAEAPKREQLVQKPFGLVYVNTVIPSQEVYNLMLEKLDEHKIRTNLNETERIFFSIIREDPSIREATYENMMNKFRGR